jgi:predicted metal-dependent hydrolase
MNPDEIARMIYKRAKIRSKIPEIIVKPVKRGRYSFRTNRITLPDWIFKDPPSGFVEYYVAHELAHGLRGKGGHGIEFQRILYRLCPQFYLYESSYKPRCYAELLRELAST